MSATHLCESYLPTGVDTEMVSAIQVKTGDLIATMLNGHSTLYSEVLMVATEEHNGLNWITIECSTPSYADNYRRTITLPAGMPVVKQVR